MLCVSFTKAQSWSQVDEGYQGSPTCIGVFNGELYLGANFPSNSGFNGIAKWNGTGWLALGTGIVQQLVTSMEWYNGKLYSGGQFGTAGGSPASNIACWNGSTWSALGSGIASPCNINSMTVYNNELYVGGWITTAGGLSMKNIARWNGTAWSTVGAGIESTGQVYSMAVYNGALYVAGNFWNVSGVPAYSMARWNGSSWSVTGIGVGMANPSSPGVVYSMIVYNGQLYAGGNFAWAGNTGNLINGLARWNGSSWSPVGTGLSNGYVTGLTIHNGELIVCGHFTSIGGVTALNIAKWNGSSWSALGSGTPEVLDSKQNGNHLMCSYNNDLFAMGRFYTPDLIEVPDRLARWTNCPIPFAVINTTSNTNICSGQTALLTSNLGPGISYQWYRNGTVISGATSSSYTAGLSGSYYCAQHTACGDDISNYIMLIPNYNVVTLNLKIYLEGFYQGGGTMLSTLYDLFTNGIGTNSNPTATDTITINLWSNNTDSLAAVNPGHSVRVVLHNDGTASCTFYACSLTGNPYYIAVKSRNAVETWSKIPINLNASVSYNFTTSLSQAYNDGINPPMKSVGGGIFAFYSGDVNQDGGIDGNDMNDIDNNSNGFGYHVSDLNGDLGTDGNDMNLVDNNVTLGLFYARPY